MQLGCFEPLFFFFFFLEIRLAECSEVQSSPFLPECNFFFFFFGGFASVQLTLAIFDFVSIVTERANHARDHLTAEAALDKYDG